MYKAFFCIFISLILFLSSCRWQKKGQVYLYGHKEGATVNQCLENKNESHPQIVKRIEASKGFFDDQQLPPANYWFFSHTDQCYLRNNKSCELILEALVLWGKNEALVMDVSSYDGDIKSNVTFAINFSLHIMLNAFSIARNKVNVSSMEERIIIDWFKTLVMNNQWSFPYLSEINNHVLLSVNVRMAFDNLVSSSFDPTNYKKQWLSVISSMRDDGSFPMETRRGASAMFYIQSMIVLWMAWGEKAQVQHLDMYKLTTEDGKSFHDAVKFSLEALENFDVFLSYAKENFQPAKAYSDYRDQDLTDLLQILSWMPLYLRRFPNHKNSEKIKNLLLDDRVCKTKYYPQICKEKKLKKFLGKKIPLGEIYDKINTNLRFGINTRCIYVLIQ